MLAVLPCRVVFEGALEDLGAEDVDPHRGKRDIRRPGHGSRCLRLFLETDDAVCFVDADDAESGPVGDRYLDRGKCGIRVVLDVEAEHLRVVHLVDVVARQHDHMARRLTGDGVEILKDGVRRAEVPVLPDAFLRRQHLDELPELFRDDVPPHPDVAVERQRLVLGGDENAAESRVDAVAEREVDDAIRSAEIDRRLGALLGQGGEPLTSAAREQDDQDIVEFHDGGLASLVHVTEGAPQVGDDSTRGAGAKLDGWAITGAFLSFWPIDSPSVRAYDQPIRLPESAPPGGGCSL